MSLQMEPIAIIGLGCRFPGAGDVAAFWKLLCEGREAITTVPADRWDAEALYDADPNAPGKMNTRSGGFVEGIDLFDSEFFGIAPREADLIDPQHRMLLEVAWEALEDAAVVPASLAGTSTGVFIGMASGNYASLLRQDSPRIDAFSNSGLSLCMAANRLSYAMDLRGPSAVVDTACSSSLYAVHLACQSLCSGESTLAIAGGVNAILTPGASLGLAKSKMLSPDGRCRVFDAGANGFGRGEGAGVVILKPLRVAVADGDPIHAIIRGTATQQGGRTNGLMAPSRRAQEAAIRGACRRAGIAPAQLRYVECHSSGTPLGDATELNAMGDAFRTEAAPGQVCAIGSVKTNIGHLEAASGIAGLIKVALMLRYRRLVPSLHFKSAVSHVGLESLPIRVQQECEPWPQCDQARLAGVSASGYGGVNVHAVMEAYETVEERMAAGDEPCRALTLSARSASALRDLASRYAAYFSRPDHGRWGDVCLTASEGRAQFNHRLAIVANDAVEARAKLLNFVEGRSAPDSYNAVSRRGAKVPAPLDVRLDTPAAIASHYVAGATIDWKSLYASSGFRRIAGLPTYAFQRQRHWMPAGMTEANPAAVQVALRPPAPATPGETEDPLASPRTATERALQTIWQEVLGHKRIGITDNFFSLGGGSLMAAEMFARVQQVLHRAPPPSVLFEHPTIEQLAAALEPGEEKGRANLLVPLRSGGTGEPLFLIAPNHLFHYAKLFQLIAPNRSIYGLQTPFSDGFRQPGITIEQMADAYLAEIVRVHPQGPCHLAGLCAGGVVAYEIARRLAGAGREVGLLGLMDAPCPPPEGSAPMGRVGYLVARSMLHVKKLRKLGVHEAIEYLRVRLAMRIGAASPLATKQQAPVDPIALATLANREAIYRYRPGRYAGRVELLMAEKPYPNETEDTRIGFRDMADSAGISRFPGEHESLLTEPNVSAVAEKINAAIAAWEAARGVRRPAA